MKSDIKYQFIHRFPNVGTLMRGPNMMRNTYLWCCQDQTHGYKLVHEDSGTSSHIRIFVCDGCLETSKTTAKASGSPLDASLTPQPPKI